MAWELFDFCRLATSTQPGTHCCQQCQQRLQLPRTASAAARGDKTLAPMLTAGTQGKTQTLAHLKQRLRVCPRWLENRRANDPIDPSGDARRTSGEPIDVGGASVCQALESAVHSSAAAERCRADGCGAGVLLLSSFAKKGEKKCNGKIKHMESHPPPLTMENRQFRNFCNRRKSKKNSPENVKCSSSELSCFDEALARITPCVCRCRPFRGAISVLGGLSRDRCTGAEARLPTDRGRGEPGGREQVTDSRMLHTYCDGCIVYNTDRQCASKAEEKQHIVTDRRSWEAYR